MSGGAGVGGRHQRWVDDDVWGVLVDAREFAWSPWGYRWGELHYEHLRRALRIHYGCVRYYEGEALAAPEPEPPEPYRRRAEVQEVIDQHGRKTS